MMQISLVAVMVGGAALSMAYYDGFLVLFALTAALLHVVRRPAVAADEALSGAPRWMTIGAAGTA
jgi:hypothetical protein